jgi:hypothetical protein
MWLLGWCSRGRGNRLCVWLDGGRKVCDEGVNGCGKVEKYTFSCFLSRIEGTINKCYSVFGS